MDDAIFKARSVDENVFKLDKDTVLLTIETSPTLAQALADIIKERGRQDEKWGEQNHDNGTGPDKYISLLGFATEVRDNAREACNNEHAAGIGTWLSIMAEEFFEAVAEDDPAKLRNEIIQLIAVGAAWVECIDRHSK